jgi:hypothetical protein
MNVIFTKKVLLYFEELIIILYDKKYFGLLETSKRYVDELVDDILTNLPTKQHKPAPQYFDKYGKDMKYAAFKKSKHTIWYVFFKTYRENGDMVYLVRYIANNHTIAQYLQIN